MQALESLRHWSKKLPPWTLLLGLLLLQGVLVLTLATPFRLFPSDDLNYYVVFMAKKGGLLAHLATEQHPFFLLYFLACAHLATWTNGQLGLVFILSSLIANTLTLAALIHLTQRHTRQSRWSLLAGLLFITSAWSNNYYFFFSYTPLPTALLLAAFACLLPCCLQAELPDDKVRRQALLAGALLGLAFWSAPAALVLIALLLSLPLLPHLRTRRQRGFFLSRWQLTGFLLTFLPFALLSFPAYLQHIQENVATNHYADAFAKFGYVPKPPFFTFPRILWEYSWLQSSLALMIVLGLGVWLLARQRAQDPRPSAPALRMGLLLLALCTLHALAIDLLPSTKLGRTHFQLFPFLILFLVIPPAYWLKQIAAPRPRQIATASYLGLLLLSLLLSAGKTLETRFLRFAAPNYLAFQVVDNIYLLTEDPHAEAIEQWLNDTRVKTVSLLHLSNMMAQEVKKGRKGMLILGPSGPGSGNTILQHATMRDFEPDLPESLRNNLTYLPYYSYHPLFLFEEEICQALYWAGQIPDQDTPESSLKIFRW